MKILTPIILSGEKKRGKIIPKIILKGYLLIREVLLALVHWRTRSIIMIIAKIERRENHSFLRVVVRPYKPESILSPLGIREAFLFKSSINRT
jgi:hypothetical protein